MTNSSEGRAPNPMQKVKQRIRAVGLRGTASRIAVLRFMLAAKTPLSHAQVADQLEDEGFDRATIYRNLVELSEAGLLSRVELGDHVYRFELRTEGAEGDGEHPHFVCVACGSVACLRDVQVDVSPKPGTKKSAIQSIQTVLLKGRCRECG